MLEHRKGIICRTTKYGESSVIADIYSSEVGMRAYIIGGVRSKSKKQSSIMQVMNIVDYVAYDTKDGKKGLSRIKEIKYDYIYRGIPFDIVKSSMGLFLIEIVHKSLKISDHNRDIFGFVMTRFKQLDNAQESLAHFHIRFLIEFCEHLGFAIADEYSEQRHYFDLRAGAFSDRWRESQYMMETDLSQALHQYIKGEIPVMTKSQRKELLSKLVDFYRYHISDFGEVRSLEVLFSLYA